MYKRSCSNICILFNVIEQAAEMSTWSTENLYFETDYHDKNQNDQVLESISEWPIHRYRWIMILENIGLL